MDKSITVAELVKGYNSRNSEDLKKRYLESVVKVLDYEDIMVLQTYADSIIKTSFYDKDGMFKLDSCKRYMVYMYTIFEYFTNIEVRSTRWAIEYGMLDRLGLIEKVKEMIPKKVIADFDTVLQMKIDDVLFENTSMPKYMDERFSKLYPIIAGSINQFLDVATEFIRNAEINE